MRKDRPNLIFVSGVIVSILAACGLSMLVTGQIRAKQTDSEKVYYSPRGYFKTAGRLNVGRSGHSAVIMSDGRILVTGGRLEFSRDKFNRINTNDTANTEIYDPKTRTSKIVSPMKFTRYKSNITLLPDGRVLVVGGWMSCVPKSKTGLCEKIPAEVYDPKKDSWTIISPGQESLRETAIAPLKTGDVLVMGGDSFKEGEEISNIFKYHVKTDQITKVGNMKFRRHYHRAVADSEGNVLVFGGMFSCTKKQQQNCLGPSPAQYAKKIELFDSHTNQSTVVGELNIPRAKLQTTLLSDGKVIISGGFSPYVPDPKFPYAKYARPENRIEIFDPKTNQSSFVAQFEGEDIEATQVIRLPHDLLLFTGVDRAYVFNPKTREVRLLDNLIVERIEHTMVLDNTGQVYLMGGWLRKSGYKTIVEVLDTNRLLKEAE